MKQIYTLYHFSCSLFLHFLRGTVLSRNYISLYFLLAAALVAVAAVEGNAQRAGNVSTEVSLKAIAGKWLVTSADINMLVEVHDTLKLTDKNCFWADHLTKGIPVRIDNLGNVSYEAFGEPATARVKIENGSLVFLFTGEKATEDGVPVPAESYTTYNFELSGGQLVIWREDGMVTEKYIFKRQ